MNFRIIKNENGKFQLQKKGLFRWRSAAWKYYIHADAEPMWYETKEEAMQAYEKLYVYPQKTKQFEVIAWWSR